MNRRDQRKADRARRLGRDAQRAVGFKAMRRRGAVHLEDDPRRFEVALWLLLHEFVRVPHAGLITTLLLGPLDVVATTNLDGVAIGVAAELRGRMTPVEHYIERIRDKTFEICGRERKTEIGWLSQSTTYLAFAIKAQFEGDGAAYSSVMSDLIALGWRDPLNLMLQRWDAVRRSNYPPHADALSATIEAMVVYLKLVRTLK